MMYAEVLVSFPQPSKVRCILEPWLHHVGFSLVYGSLALKTWRVVLIFRVRSARKVAITDSVLLRRLSAIVLLYLSYLTVWMVIQPPSVEQGITADKLKYERCTKGWFGYIILAADFVVLAWGMWLSFKVRKAPQVYNESRFISYATYNAMFIMCFINVLSAVLRNGSSPTVAYAMEFAYVHVTASVTLVLLFSHKICLVMAMRNDYRRTAPQNNILSVNSMGGRLTEVLDTTTLGGENNELKLEIKRLASKVALLQSQLMTEQNRHVKRTGSS
ncbi:putative G-protein coupled receptor CG31760 [Oculina patagonica]